MTAGFGTRWAFLLSITACQAAAPSWQDQIARGEAVVKLPAGLTLLDREIVVPSGVEISGSDHGASVIRASPRFRGRAVFVVVDSRRVRFRGLTVEGNRAALEQRVELPPDDTVFADFYRNNGILLRNAEDVRVADVTFRQIGGFAVLATQSRRIVVERIRVTDSGSRNRRGRNNTTGGVLFEEGASGFSVIDSEFLRVLGNAVWTHSWHRSPRNREGRIAGNRFDTIGRDAIQVGHATGVRVENNVGRNVGRPDSVVDVEGGGTPVGIDTAGNVDASAYVANRFYETNGKCIDLDGFHHGEVRDNVCVNRAPAGRYAFGHYAIVMNNTNPAMESRNIVISGNEVDGTKFGGIFVIGSGHRIEQNRLLNLNRAGCNQSAARFGCEHFAGEPDLLRSGIYLGRRAERPAPARGNLIRGNLITGHGMAARCVVAAPGVTLQDNRVEDNRCEDTQP